MEQLTPGQQQYLAQLEEEIYSKFTEPEYKNYRLIYTTDPSKADVTISKHHTALDYLAIGFVALAKQSREKPPVLVAMHEQKKEESQYCQVYIGPTMRPLYHTALTGIYKQIDSIVAKHMSHPRFAPFGIGLALPSYFACLHMGYLENPDINMEFENFNDILYAQKLAFSNLQKYTISSYLGSLESYITGNG